MTLEDPLSPAPEEQPDGARFRQVLGHFATGVTIITVVSDDRPAGLSVNSFCSVSLAPPLVSFCVTGDSTTWTRIQAAGTFCVNVLGEDQEGLCRKFASRSTDKFLGVGWRPSPSGSPVLDGVLAWIDCALEAHYPAGDHVLVLGRVVSLDVVHEGRPLVFYRGGYGRFEP